MPDRVRLPYLVLALAACAPPARRAAPEACLTVGAWNDLHGQIQADQPFVDTGVLPAGGVIALADAIADLRATTDPVLLLDAGDLFTGPLESTMAEGAPIIEAYRAIGVDAVAIGNHEFDFGPAGYAAVYARPGDDQTGRLGPRGALQERMRAASFPFLSANIHRTDGTRPHWPNFGASLHLHRGAFDIGVVGYTTQETPSTTSHANVSGLDFSTAASASVAAEIRALRASGASPVILLAHASLDGALPQALDAAPSEPEHGELATLIAGLGRDRPDVIIAGHRHAWMLGRVDGIPTVSSDQHGVGLARLRFCRTTGAAELRSIERVAVLAATPPRTQLGREVAAVTAPWIAAVKARGDELVAALPRDCPVRSVNGTAGAEQVAQSMLAQAPDIAMKPDGVPVVALVNIGAIRAPLRKGVVRYSDLFRSFPFETTVSVCRTTREGFAHILKNALLDPSAWKEFPFALAGARATVDLAQNGALSLLGYTIDTDPGSLETTSPVWVVIPDFILDGGDGFLNGVECTTTARSSVRIRDAWREVLARDPDGCGGAPTNVVIRSRD